MIELTPEQRQAIIIPKISRFRELLKAAEEETGMTMVPYLEFVPTGIIPKLAVIERSGTNIDIKTK